MSLLVSGVLADVMKVRAADDESSVHFGRDDGAGDDTSADGDLTDEWAFLVNVGSVYRRLWGLEAQSDLFVPSSTLSCLFLLSRGLVSEKDVRLLLESTFRLDCEFGSHDGIIDDCRV